MLHTQLAALALAATTLAASGCGGSSKTESATTVAATGTAATTTSATSTTATAEPGKLTNAELIAKTDAICARINAKRASTNLKNIQDYTRLVPPLGAYEQAAAAELSKLTPPASTAGEWQQIAGRVQTVANDTAKIGHDIVTKQDNAGSALLTKLSNVVLQLNTIAKREGYKNCAQS